MSKTPHQVPALADPIQYDPDVLRVAQRHADQLRAIAELEQSRKEWQERALVAEKLNNSLDLHIKQIERDFSRERNEDRQQHTEFVQRMEHTINDSRRQAKEDIDRLTHERDYWRDKYVRVEENLTAAGQIILDVLDRAAKRKEEVANGPLKVIADAISATHQEENTERH